MRLGTVCFFIRDKKILLAYIESSPTNKKWSGIGGFVNEGETPEDAVCREVKEEVDLVINKDALKKVTVRNYPQRNVQLQVYIYKTHNDEFRVIDPTIKDLQWFEFDTVPYLDMYEDNKDWLPQILTQE